MSVVPPNLVVIVTASGASSLPNRPSAEGYSAAQIKAALNRGNVILARQLIALDDARIHDIENAKVFVSSLENASDYAEGTIAFLSANNTITAYIQTGGAWVQIGDDIASTATQIDTLQSDVSDLSNDCDSLEGRMTNAEGRLDANDTEEATHHHLKTDGDGYIYQEFPTSEGEGTSDNKLMNHADGVSINSAIGLLKDAVVALMSLKTYEQSEIESILSGALSVGHAKTAQKATTDSNGNPISVVDYAKNITVAYNASTGVITLNLLNQNGAIIDTKTIDLPAELCFSAVAYDAATHSFNFTTTAGAVINVPATDLVDTYVGSTGTTITVSVNNNTISAEVVDGSITLAKLASSFQTTWQGWVDAEAARVLAENGRVSAEAQRVANENARLARPYLCYDADGYICINYGSGRDITID